MAIKEKDKYFKYRGDIKDAIGLRTNVIFVTEHSEGHPTSIYRINVDKSELKLDPLPAGAVALIIDKDAFYVSCSDKRIDIN